MFPQPQTIGSELFSFLTSVFSASEVYFPNGEKNWRMPRLFEEFGLYNQLQGYYFVGFFFFFLVTFDLKY